MTDFGKMLVVIIAGIIVVSILVSMWRNASRELSGE